MLLPVRLSNGELIDTYRVAQKLIFRLRDQMNLIEESSDMDQLAGSVENTGGVYFVTAFSGLLAPYWDREAVSLQRPLHDRVLINRAG